MSFKKNFILSLFFLLGLGGSFGVHADSVECGSAFPGGVETVFLRCDGYQTGFVKNEAALDYLKVVVTKNNGQQKVYTLKNPPGDIRAYSTGLGGNSWVISQLRGKLAYGDTVEPHYYEGYGVKSGTPLYADVFAKEQVGELGQSGRSSAPTSCRYTSRPTVITTKSCGVFCMSEIDCNIDGTRYTGQVFCKADKGGEACPSADKCAEDNPDIPKKPAVNYNKFGDPVEQNEKAPAGASSRSQSDSTGGSTSSGNEAGSKGSLQ